MPRPLSPAMLAALLFAVGIATGHADYVDGMTWHTWTAAAATAALYTLFIYTRRTARWRWAVGALCAAALAGGWTADRMTWRDIRQRQAHLMATGTDNHLGVITAPPTRAQRTWQVEVATDDGRVRLAIPHALLDGDTLWEGHTLLFRSRLRPQDMSTDYGAAHLHRGIIAGGYVTAVRQIETRPEGVVMRCRVWLLKRLRRIGLSAQAAAMGSALLLADRSGLDSGTREAYRRAGASHLLALSGMHLGLLVCVLASLMGREYRHERRKAVGISLIAWAYTVMAGMPLSLVRAATMLTVALAGRALYRHMLLLDALWAALLVMLIIWPHALYDAGAQLSFACMMGLAVAELLTPVHGDEYVPYVEHCPTLTERHPRLRRLASAARKTRDDILAMVLTAVVCTVASMPVTAYHFGQVPIYSCVSGLVLIPLTMLTIAVTAVALVLPHPILCDALSTIVAWQADIAAWFAQLPCAVI